MRSARKPSKRAAFSFSPSDRYVRVFFPSSSKASRVICQLIAGAEPSPYSSSNFLWSKYFSLIGERPISDEYFDHYLASVESSLEVDMRLEYCYDVQRDMYWLTQIQMICHRLLLLHYVGLPEEDTSHDFWAYVYDQRCHPMGWCKENSKTMLPPSVVTERTAINLESDSGETPPAYLFDQVRRSPVIIGEDETTHLSSSASN